MKIASRATPEGLAGQMWPTVWEPLL